MPKEQSATLSLDRYAPDARAWIVAAQTLADERVHSEVTPLHLLSIGLERYPGVTAALRHAGANAVEMTAVVARALAALPRGDGPAYFATRLLDLLGRAERDADRERARDVRMEHVLGALAQEIRGPAGEILGAFGIGPGTLKPHLAAVRGAERSAPALGAQISDSVAARDLVRDARESHGDPVIGRDTELLRLVTILARRDKCHPLLVGEPGVGKRAIIRALAERLANGDVPSRLAGLRLLEVDLGVLLSGARLRSDVEGRLRRLAEAGDGQRAAILVIFGVEQIIGQGPQSVAADALRSLVSRSDVRFLATTSAEGLRRITEKDPLLARGFAVLEVEEPPVELAVEMLRGVAGRLEEHHGLRIGESAILAAASLAKRYLSDRHLPDSAIDLLDESAASLCVERDGMPPDVDHAVRRLRSLRTQLASFDGVEDPKSRAARDRLAAEADALEPRVVEMRRVVESRRAAVAAVRMLEAEQVRAERALAEARGAREDARAGELEHVTIPALVARFQAAEQAAVAAGANLAVPILDEERVASLLGNWTGIPVAKMLEAEAEKLLKMEERLEQRVVGQSEGVRALARAVRRGRVGLRDPRRPIGSFLFLGPSGVGKTELAKALAEFLFDDEAALTRLDMSEFMERHMAQRLLGAPPGYADSEQGGFLTEAVRKRPYSVLLFDEVEKAHEDVFNLLLQVLDDGRLTDGRGRLADFTNTVVILTSNIGSDRILEADGRVFDSELGRNALRDVLLDQLGKFFRPEFLNRIDDVIVFRPLARDDLARIVDIQLDRVRVLLEPRRVRLEVDAAARERLVEEGYEPALGARPLRRAILKRVQDPVAEKLLEQGVREGATLKVRLEGDEIVCDVS